MSNRRVTGKTRLLVFLETKQHAGLKQLSAATGAPMNWHIREAVSRYLVRQPRRREK